MKPETLHTPTDNAAVESTDAQEQSRRVILAELHRYAHATGLQPGHASPHGQLALVAGPVWRDEDGFWNSEAQVCGGDTIVASFYDETEAGVIRLRDAFIATLSADMDAKAGTPEGDELSRLAAELEAYEASGRDLEASIRADEERTARQAERYSALSANLGFHWKNGWFFGRTEDGSVRVARLCSYDYEPSEVMVIDAGSWRSICDALAKATPPAASASGAKPMRLT